MEISKFMKNPRVRVPSKILLSPLLATHYQYFGILRINSPTAQTGGGRGNQCELSDPQLPVANGSYGAGR
jgi:hypothetical protein